MPYVPKPVDTDDIAIPDPLQPLIETLAEQVHESWASTRMAQGWTYGPERNDARKEHPSLVPYADLTEAEKELDRVSVLSTLRLILHFGYRIEAPDTDPRK